MREHTEKKNPNRLQVYNVDAAIIICYCCSRRCKGTRCLTMIPFDSNRNIDGNYVNGKTIMLCLTTKKILAFLMTIAFVPLMIDERSLGGNPHGADIGRAKEVRGLHTGLLMRTTHIVLHVNGRLSATETNHTHIK